MRNIKEYLQINEVSRDLVYQAYMKASGGQKQRILKLYHEIYDKSDDLTLEDPNVITVYKELYNAVNKFIKNLVEVYNNEKEKNKNIPFRLTSCEAYSSGYGGRYTGEPSADSEQSVLFGLRFTGSERKEHYDMQDFMRNYYEKSGLLKKIKRLEEKYPDIIRVDDDYRGERAWYCNEKFVVYFKKPIPCSKKLPKAKENPQILTRLSFFIAWKNCGIYGEASDGEKTYWPFWDIVTANRNK